MQIVHCLAKGQLRNFKVFLVSLLIPSFLFGVENTNSVLALLQNGLQNWIPIIKTACLWVFWTLVVIDITWSFGKMALSGFEIGEFFATLIKKIIYIGVFLFLFNTDQWLQILFNSFSQLATEANKNVAVMPGNITTSAAEILLLIWDKMSILNIPKSLFMLICGLIILIAFVLMAIDLLIVYLKFYLINIIIFFALALGGLEHFRQIGLNPIVSGIKIGIELFMVQGLMALAINTVDVSFKELNQNVSVDLVLQILIVSLIFCIVTKMVAGLIEAVFSGGVGESAGASGGFRAAAVVAGGAMLGAAAGGIGATRALSAAKELHLAQGGGGGMDLVKGVAKNLATAGMEHLKENSTHARMSNDIANRLQRKTENLQTNDSFSGTEQSQQATTQPQSSQQQKQQKKQENNEPYQSGIQNVATIETKDESLKNF